MVFLKLKRKGCFFLILIMLFSVFAAGLGAQSGFSEEEDYEYVDEKWDFSKKINFNDYWNGSNRWGKYHRVYSLQINTQKLIKNDMMRSDCLDVRVASEEQLLGTRVQDNTCNTSDTWIYFSNPDIGDELKFDPNASIGNIQVFYGNKNAGLGKYTTSVYNDDIATILKPESAIGMYYGHHQSVYVNDDTDNTNNDRDAPSQRWTVDFETDHGDTPTNTITISDDDGNSVSRNSDDDYTIDSSNVPSWVEQGDELTIYFTSNEVCYDGCSTATSSPKSAIWGYPVSFSNPEPAKSTSSSPVDTTNPNLSINITQPSGNNVDVTFYDDSTSNQIGTTQTVYGGSGKATVEWTGLTQANTYNWYAKACSSGNCKTSSTYEFDVNGFPQITNLYFTNKSNGHRFEAEITVEDPNGDSDLDSCESNVSADGISNTYTGLGFENVDGDNDATCDVIVDFDDSSPNWDHLENVNITFNVSDSKNEDNISGDNTFPNNKPQINSLTFSNYSNGHKFNTTAELVDFDSENPDEIDQCQMKFSDDDGNSLVVYPSINYSFGNQNQSKCHYSNVNNTAPSAGIGSGFEVGEQITVNLTIKDGHGNETSRNKSNTIPNNKPTSYDPDPKDGDTVSEYPVGISATVLDSDNDKINLTVYNQTGSKIYTENNMNSGVKFNYDWNVPNVTNTDYDWIVETSDYWSSTNETFEFTKILGRTYRTSLAFDLNYSSITMPVDSTEYVSMRLENNVQEDKNVTVSLRGINSVFMDGSTTKYIPDFSGGSERDFVIRVNPEQKAEGDLIVDVRNNDLGINKTEVIPVKVTGSTRGTIRSVPGIKAYQIILLMALSTVLYFVEL